MNEGSGSAAQKVTATVKVMRSYDYCHFEVSLGADEMLSLDEVNELRKKAALLVDEAVRQYKIAKRQEAKRESYERDVERFLERIKYLKSKNPSELSVEESAVLRVYANEEYWKEIDDEAYYYDHDPERDHHFSMLEQFKNQKARV